MSEHPVPASRWRPIVRWIAGVLAILGLLVIWANRIAESSATVPAADLARLDADNILAAIIVLGICGGLYSISRAGE